MVTWKLKATCLFLLLFSLTTLSVIVQNINRAGKKLRKSSAVVASDQEIHQPKPPHSHSQSFNLTPAFDFNTTCDTSCDIYIRANWQWTMVTFIKSAADNFKRRSFIRRTWGSIRYTSSGRFLFVFVIGRPSSEQAFSLVKEEWERNQDILLYDGPDDYRNIARKTLAGMQWASVNLDADLLYSSADDDFLLDIAIFQSIINENIKRVQTSQWPSFPFVCTYGCVDDVMPIRDRRHKNYLPYDWYRWDKFPRFCLGGFYTTSVAVIKQVWDISDNEHALPTDDVWITGILRQKTGMPEYAVIAPKQGGAARHFVGFRDHGDPSSRTFLGQEWAETYEKISQLPHCVCQ